jgi:hypothetical protein
MAANEQQAVDVYVGRDNPYIFTWGGVRFRIYQGDPPEDHARVEPSGPSGHERPSRPTVTLTPDRPDVPYMWPIEPAVKGPERVGVVRDLDALQVEIGERLAGTPVRVHIDAGIYTSDWSELRPVLRNLEGILGSETEVVLAPGPDTPIHG